MHLHDFSHKCVNFCKSYLNSMLDLETIFIYLNILYLFVLDLWNENCGFLFKNNPWLMIEKLKLIFWRQDSTHVGCVGDYPFYDT